MKVAILGADGSMGRIISRLAIEDPGVEVCAAFTEPGSPATGMDAGTLAGKAALGIGLVDASDLAEHLRAVKPDVVIDFTVAAATEVNAPVAWGQGCKMVIGTTGLSREFLETAAALVKAHGAPSIIASNMAPGMNVFMDLVEQVAGILAGWDVEIIEAHHHRKRDAPSGTAITLAERIASGLGKDVNQIAKFGRSRGSQPRVVGSDEVGIHAIRAGDIVGDHTVLYAGNGERIELVHRAHDRSCFAAGALQAAKYLASHAVEARLYSMKDVLARPQPK